MAQRPTAIAPSVRHRRSAESNHSSPREIIGIDPRTTRLGSSQMGDRPPEPGPPEPGLTETRCSGTAAAALRLGLRPSATGPGWLAGRLGLDLLRLALRLDESSLGSARVWAAVGDIGWAPAVPVGPGPSTAAPAWAWPGSGRLGSGRLAFGRLGSSTRAATARVASGSKQ